ncbi:MAG: electron transfer flavoprotein subunit alpha/FixB family protein [Deltaproteobacteria bacterium]|nr:electron transfer flavoprotein subunit alpha/FixB family protein [Deltaproteobacteria bacterium]
MGNVLVFAEHQKGKFPKSTLIAVQAGKEAASKLGGNCLAAVLGSGVDALAQEIAGYGVTKALAADDPALANYLADAYAATLEQVIKANDVSLVLATSTAIGKDLLPRVAARLGVGMATDIVGINADGTFLRPMYAGNVLATVALEDAVKVVSVRGTAFDAAQPSGQGAVEKVSVSLDASAKKMQFVDFSETKSDRPNLTEARIVVSGGRGLKSGENFTVYLEPLVDVLGAAMGASRAAVDAGFVPNDLQVGQTGKVVAPELYFAIGISGAIQHLAGMKDSKVIVAINKDPDAPIFSVADYGLVADLFKSVPELTEEIKKTKG